MRQLIWWKETINWARRKGLSHLFSIDPVANSFGASSLLRVFFAFDALSLTASPLPRILFWIYVPSTIPKLMLLSHVILKTFNDTSTPIKVYSPCALSIELQMLHSHIPEYGHVRNGHIMFITIEHRNLEIRKHVTTSCSGTKPFY